jgi:hypothetical protein
MKQKARYGGPFASGDEPQPWQAMFYLCSIYAGSRAGSKERLELKTTQIYAHLLPIRT